MLEEPLVARRRRPLAGGLGRLAELAPPRTAAALLAGLPLLVIVAIAFTVTALFTRSIHGFTVMPDELGYVKQSIEIWKSGPPVGSNDFYFNSWAQLLPLISAPIFGGLGMVKAYYTSHTVYAFLLASTAIPAYLLARELRLGRLAAYLVAALSVAVPWMVLAGLVMTEVVAYPAFVWAILAMVRALHAPSARRDVVAIAAVAVAFFARTEFVALGPILAIAALLHDVMPAATAGRGSSVHASVMGALRQTLSVHRVLWAVSAVAIIAVIALAIRGSLESVLGSYVTPLHGTLVPAGTFAAGFKELDGVTLGIGIVPLALAATWALATVVRPRDPARHAFAVLLLVCGVVFLWLVGSFDARFLGGNTTDRYMFYFAPLLFTGAAAWVVDRRGSLVSLAVVGALVAWMVLTVALHGSAASIIDPSFAIHRAFGLDAHAFTHALGLADIDPRVLLVLIATAFVVLVLVSRRRLATPWALLALAVPLLAYGVANTGYVMTKLSEQYSVIPADHPKSLTSIDRLVPASARVGLVIAPYDNETGQSPVDTWYAWWQPSFWNKKVQRAFVFPGDDTFAQGFVAALNQDLARGRLAGLDGVNYLLKLGTDTRFALRAQRSIGPYLLDRVTPGAPLLYGTSGVDQYSRLEPFAHPFLRIFGSGTGQPVAERVSLTLQAPAAQADCPCRIDFGPAYGIVTRPAALLIPGHAAPVIRAVTVPPHGFAQLNLTVTGRDGQPVPWVTLLSVRITNASPRP